MTTGAFVFVATSCVVSVLIGGVLIGLRRLAVRVVSYVLNGDIRYRVDYQDGFGAWHEMVGSKTEDPIVARRTMQDAALEFWPHKGPDVIMKVKKRPDGYSRWFN